MTQAELDEMRARCEAATDGPWEALGKLDDGGGDPEVNTVSEIAVKDWDGTEIRSQFICKTTDDDLSWTRVHNVDADTEFIAHSRADVPRLLDEVGRMREVLWGVEWEGTNPLDSMAHNGYCPVCGGYENDGHKADCELIAAIGQE